MEQTQQEKLKMQTNKNKTSKQVMTTSYFCDTSIFRNYMEKSFLLFCRAFIKASPQNLQVKHLLYLIINVEQIFACLSGFVGAADDEKVWLFVWHSLFYPSQSRFVCECMYVCFMLNINYAENIQPSASIITVIVRSYKVLCTGQVSTYFFVVKCWRA